MTKFVVELIKEATKNDIDVTFIKNSHLLLQTKRDYWILRLSKKHNSVRLLLHANYLRHKYDTVADLTNTYVQNEFFHKQYCDVNLSEVNSIVDYLVKHSIYRQQRENKKMELFKCA